MDEAISPRETSLRVESKIVALALAALYLIPFGLGLIRGVPFLFREAGVVYGLVTLPFLAGAVVLGLMVYVYLVVLPSTVARFDAQIMTAALLIGHGLEWTLGDKNPKWAFTATLLLWGGLHSCRWMLMALARRVGSEEILILSPYHESFRSAFIRTTCLLLFSGLFVAPGAVLLVRALPDGAAIWLGIGFSAIGLGKALQVWISTLATEDAQAGKGDESDTAITSWTTKLDETGSA